MPYADPDRHRQYQRERLARIRAEWLADKSCVVCGTTEDLQVDHIDPKTKITHNVWSWTASRREAELAKCQVLCRPHHNEKTARERRAHLAPHGTLTRYADRVDPCRCAACREVHRSHKKAWRERRRAQGLRAS